MIVPLEKIYPLELCFNIISNYDFDPRLRYSFTKLIITLWVDRAPYIKMIVPNKIRIWSELNFEIFASSEDTNKFSDLKNFVIDYLNKLREKGRQESFNVDENLLTESVLQLAK